LSILNKYIVVEIHPFAIDEDTHSSPFIGEIEKHGIFLIGEEAE